MNARNREILEKLNVIALKNESEYETEVKVINEDNDDWIKFEFIMKNRDGSCEIIDITTDTHRDVTRRMKATKCFKNGWSNDLFDNDFKNIGFKNTEY